MGLPTEKNMRKSSAKSVFPIDQDGNILGYAAGGIPATISDFVFQAKLGNINGAEVVHKFGSNKAIGTSIVPIAAGGIYRTPVAAVNLEIVSTSTSDSVNGAGAQVVQLQGLDQYWNPLSEDVETNGTGASSATTNKFLRLFRVKVIRSGTYGTQSAASQKGALTIRESGGGDTWASLPIIDTNFGIGQSLIAAYSVKAGYTAYITHIFVSVNIGANKTIDVYLYDRENGGDIVTPYTGVIQIKNELIGLGSSFELRPLSPFGPYPERTDVGFMGKGEAADLAASVDFEILLLNNNIFGLS